MCATMNVSVIRKKMHHNRNEDTTLKKHFNTKYMVELAMMIAIIIVMSLTPLGYIKLPGLTITFLTVPVAIGAIVLGPLGGAVCGAAFGFTSLYQAVSGGSAFTAMLFSINPAGTIFLTLIPRILEGWLTGLIFLALHKNRVMQRFSYYIASLACPLLNTLLFMSSLIVIFYNTDYIQSFVTKLGVSNPFTFVVAFVGTQGLIEAVVCFIVASIITRALYKVLKTM